MRIILSGSMGRLPFGGQAWIDMQYLAGLRKLGHDVYYLEECGQESWVYNWETGQETNDIRYPAGYVRHCLEPLGMEYKWIYRAGQQAEGMPIDSFSDLCAEADLLLIRAVPLQAWRREYTLPRHTAFIDADPGFTQMNLLQGHEALAATVEHSGTLFTVGQRLGAPDCKIPLAGREWIKTVPPVALEYWPVTNTVDEAGAEGGYFTSILNWSGYRDVEYKGIVYGQRNMEFPHFVELPQQTSQRFKIAVTGGNKEWLQEHGWQVEEGWRASRTPELYRNFIQKSKAEFGVAKQGYVSMRGGWFSDRSVCYLASGRPVLVQDTGLIDWLPLGEGIMTFRDLPEALRGIELINSEYERHRRGARRIAEHIFSADRVLPPLIDAAVR